MKLIIDANNLAYRANMTTDLFTKSGERVSGIYGSIQMVQSYLKQTQGKWKNHMLEALTEHLGLDEEEAEFDGVVTCWDFGKSKRRMELFPEYKGHREERKATQSEDDKNAFKQFLNQMDQLHEILPKMGVKSLKFKGWEGDDLVYACTELYKDDICVVVSTDKDMLQLVNENCFVWSPFKETLVTPSNFFNFTKGVSKHSYLDFRVLVGDSSDNINGVAGVGEKTAKDLLIKFKDINGIKANQHLLMKSKRTAKIFEDLRLLERNEKLMGFQHVDFSDIRKELEELLFSESKFIDKDVRMFLASKQFASIMSDFLMWSNPFKNLR